MGRMAGTENGAQLVPISKLARLTCGVPDWSSRAAEEFQPRDVDCSPAQKGAGDDCCRIERCAGIDVGKEQLDVHVMVGPLAGEPRCEYRQFGTITAELKRLRQWLEAEG